MMRRACHFHGDRGADGVPAGDRRGRGFRLRGRGESAAQAARTLLKLLHPIAPHLSDEWWDRLGGEALLIETRWPEYDPALATSERVTLVVQVNGKVRGRLDVDRGAAEAEALALARADGKIRAWVDGKRSPGVYVPDRLPPRRRCPFRASAGFPGRGLGSILTGACGYAPSETSTLPPRPDRAFGRGNQTPRGSRQRLSARSRGASSPSRCCPVQAAAT